MHRRYGVLVKVLLVMMGLVFLVGCEINRVETGPTLTERQVVELGNTEEVRAEIHMGVGDLAVSGGASELLDAQFTYNVEDWRPEVDYEVNGDTGNLVIQQPDVETENGPTIPDDDLIYRWDLKFNDSVPMALDIDLGVGEGNVEVGGINLTSLRIDTGVGKTTIDLTGKWQRSFAVDVDAGIGEVVVRVPSDVGVRADLAAGIGELRVEGFVRNGDTYTNAAYNTSEVTIDLSVQGGVGKVRLEQGE